MSEKANSTKSKQADKKAPEPAEAGPQSEAAETGSFFGIPPGTFLGDLPPETNARAIRERAAINTQQQAGNRALISLVQRQPAPGGGGKGTFNWGGLTLSADGPAMRQLLEDMVAQKGLKATRNFVYGEFSAMVSDLEGREGASGASGGTSAPGGTNASTEDLTTLRPIRSTLKTQYDTLEKEAAQFIQDFESTAEGVVFTMLQESENKLLKEAERYGLMGGPQTLNPMELNTGAATENADNAALATAAGHLLALKNEIDKLISERSKLYKPDDPFQLFLDKAREQELTTQINEKEEQANKLTGQFPILAGFKDDSQKAKLEAMSKGGGAAAASAGGLIKQQLENIKLVRGGLERDQLKIWNLPKIVQGTKAKMGLGPTTMGNKVADDHMAQVKSDETLVNLAVAALTIAIGLIAAVPTGGAGGAMVAAGASAVSAGVSAYQAASALQEYQLAEAMNATDPDKAKAISSEDPSLFWLALDIVGLIADVRGAFAAFKALAPEVKTVLAVTEDFDKIDESLKSFKETCTAAKVPSLYDRVVARVRAVLDKNKGAIDELKKTAQARYAGLSAKEKEQMAKAGITEEKFIEQMAANASRDMVISGAEGTRRTQMITELMQPNNPMIAAINAGDVRQMDALLIQHGSWQQLMSQLSAGTPEMKAASQNLVGRRRAILKEVEESFMAKPVSGASKEAVSDVDLITSGDLDAGAMMIKAEEFVKSKYGAGWSEALRMNFYTMAERLYMYAREMKGLPKEARAGLLKEMSKQNDIYTVAKMMEYARGDPAALKRAQEYARTLGVDSNSPEIAKLLSLSNNPAVRLEERNKLLLRADELMRKYNSLPPTASPQERMALAKEISENQMRANFYTEEAYIGPGAARMAVSGIDVVGFEAKMAVTSQLSMIAHEVSRYGGKAELAMREYEIYKYINRFAAAARKAGSSHPGLSFYENLSAFIYKTERTGASSYVHLTDLPGKTAPIKNAPYLAEGAPRIDEVTDKYLLGVYNDFTRFSHDVMKEIDLLSSQNPGAWTPFNVPRPNAGPMPK